MKHFLVNKLESGQKVRVNVRTLVNSAGIRRERRAGRDVIVVPSATMPDGIVMNGVRYPAAEIAKSFHTLDRTPAPLGHPEVEGAFVSASDPEGLARSWVGAWNTNVRQENGRVLLDKVIDVQAAQQLVGGRAILEAIEKGEPIHTSTGLVCMLDNAEENAADGAAMVAREIVFDHDAMLLGEDGAATPSQGVGMLVNSASGPEKIEVINSSLSDNADENLDWAIMSLTRALKEKQDVSFMERFKSAIESLYSGFGKRETSTNGKEEGIVRDEDFKALEAKVNTIESSVSGLVSGLGEQITNAVTSAVKPIADSMAAIDEAEKAKEEQELEGLRNKIVTAELMDKESASELTINAARKLAEKVDAASTGRVSYALHSAAPKPTGTKSQYAVPKAEG